MPWIPHSPPIFLNRSEPGGEDLPFSRPTPRLQPACFVPSAGSTARCKGGLPACYSSCFSFRRGVPRLQTPDSPSATRLLRFIRRGVPFAARGDSPPATALASLFGGEYPASRHLIPRLLQPGIGDSLDLVLLKFRQFIRGTSGIVTLQDRYTSGSLHFGIVALRNRYTSESFSPYKLFRIRSIASLITERGET